MATDWTKPYSASHRLVLVDRATGGETEVGDALVAGGSVIRDDGTQVKESADITVVGDFDPDPMLVRIYADIKQDGQSESFPLGTFVANTDSSSFDGAAKSLAVSLDGRLTELAHDAFETPFTVEAGTSPVAYAQSIGEACGFTVVADPSTYTLTQPRCYSLDADQSKLDVINDLLDVAGFSAAKTDPMGNLLFRRYVEPSQRPIAASYSSGDGSVLQRSITDSADGSEVANVVIVVYSTQESTVVGTAVDDLPTSRWSTVARGRRIVKRYSYSDTVTQAQADAKAAELLATNQSVVRHVTFSVPYDSGVTIASAVSLDYPESGVTGTFAVVTQTFDLSSSMQMSTEARAYVRR